MGSVVKSIAPIAGGVAGSFFGPAGAVIGSTLASGLAGSLMPEKQKQFGAVSTAPLKQIGSEYAGMNDVQRQALIDQQNALQGKQLAAQLSGQALGTAPSIAEAQLRSATNRNLQQQLAAAASMRGRNPAAMQRQLLQQQGEAGRQLAEQSAVARLQEQQQAMQTAMQANQANQSQIAQNLQAGYGYKSAAPLAAIQAQQQANALNAQVQAANVAAQNQMTGSLLGAAGQLGAAYIGKSGGTPSSPGTTSTGNIPRMSNASLWDGGIIPADASAMEKSVVYSGGGQVPGEAEARGDSPRNDKVPAMLSPGEIVIPRSHATPAKAKKFVEQLLATGKSPVSNMPAAKLRPSDADNKHPGSNSQDIEEILHAHIARKKGKKA